MDGRIIQLISSKDGSLSMPKLAAASAHFLMACSFLKFQVLGTDPFSEIIWGVYGGFAILHAASDKAMAQFTAFKTRKLEMEESGVSVLPAGEEATTVVTTTSTAVSTPTPKV